MTEGLASERFVAVVLAGGRSRRFGTDKLAASIDGMTLLDRSLDALPAGVELIIVGPERDTLGPARFVREDPPGGGPAAAMLAGLHAALSSSPAAVVVFPADAPRGGESAALLLHRLRAAAAYAVVGVDRSGRDQPLQLALRRDAVEALVARAGPHAGAGQSARELLSWLEPALVRQPLDGSLAFDIDTSEDALVWQLQASPAVEMIIKALPARRPAVVALDGRSGAGKSTLAAALALRTGGIVVPADELDESWIAGQGRKPELTILDGTYSARPELAELVDLAVLVELDEGTRSHRLAGRVAADPETVAAQERAEEHYFGLVRPPPSFDLRLAPSQ